ncbi:MAG: oxidoreductase [Desulfobacterota bacterium]|nr:oxidoreductase [Thermodesulfobacteriota bacterium]MDW8001977.1 oxidoreductase [Deltaproteobacteria bacterium]
MGKPQIAICWLGACGGCDETILDLNEDILRIADLFEIVLWPVAMDFKYEEIETLKDGQIFVSVINGSVRNSENYEILKLLRKKSTYVVAFGACACFGGTPSLANLLTKDDIFRFVYRDAPTVVNPERNAPLSSYLKDGRHLTLPEFYEEVKPVSEVVDVDYFLPGCPPSSDLVREMFNIVSSGDLPPKGTTLASSVALCAVCQRNDTKPERLEIRSVKRIHEIEADPNLCFLAQGVICLGPSTRSGCGNVCLDINLPCRGCMGPVEALKDMGSKYLSMLSCLVEGNTEEERRRVIDGIADPVGYFYRFTIGSSIIRKRR